MPVTVPIIDRTTVVGVRARPVVGRAITVRAIVVRVGCGDRAGRYRTGRKTECEAWPDASASLGGTCHRGRANHRNAARTASVFLIASPPSLPGANAWAVRWLRPVPRREPANFH